MILIRRSFPVEIGGDQTFPSQPGKKGLYASPPHLIGWLNKIASPPVLQQKLGSINYCVMGGRLEMWKSIPTLR